MLYYFFDYLRLDFGFGQNLKTDESVHILRIVFEKFMHLTIAYIKYGRVYLSIIESKVITHSLVD